MPRKKTIKKPGKPATYDIKPLLCELSEDEVRTLKINHAHIPQNYDLYSALENIYDIYQSMDTHTFDKPAQSDIQESLRNISVYTEWLGEWIDNISSVKNKTLRKLLLDNGCQILLVRDGMDDLAHKVLQLSDAAKIAYENNMGKKSTKDTAREYAIREIAKLWKTATGQNPRMSTTAGSRNNNSLHDTINTPFGYFLKDIFALFGIPVQSDTSLMQAYRVATKI